MSQATYVKEVVTGTGKKKFRAEIWLKGIFYTSKTFDLKNLAVRFKEAELEKAIKGTLLPAKARREKRIVNSGLDKPMTYWTCKYVTENPGKHGKKRLDDYELVGQLLAKKTLQDFHGRKGAQYIEQLMVDWKHGRQARSLKPGAAELAKQKPLEDNTVRLRLSALMRTLRFAHASLPDEANFRVPDLKADLFEFKLPEAHGNPRKRLPSDREYKSLLDNLENQTDFSEFLRIIDETGCRLSEVLNARDSEIDFFCSEQTIIGGCLTLEHHKTKKKTQVVRHVPLSQAAAQLFAGRILDVTGNGPLFESLGNVDAVCKAFDDARTAIGVTDLLLKDFRRAFINRNKYCMSSLDLFAVTGNASMLDVSNATDSEKAVMTAVGHTSLKTTAGYSVADIQRLSKVFTLTSRLSRVVELGKYGSCIPESDTVEIPAASFTDLDITEAEVFNRDSIGESEISVTLHPTSPDLWDEPLLRLQRQPGTPCSVTAA